MGGITISMFVLILFFPLLIGGIVLLVLGLRGRAINNHPICRKCRFDLIGLAAAPGQDAIHSGKCPECGTDLASPGAIRTGARTRRKAPLIAGLLMLLVSVAIIALVAFAASQRINWYRFFPDGVLVGMAERGNPSGVTEQLTELLRRGQDGSLSPEHSAALIRRALAVQADKTGTWSGLWGDIVESGRAAGNVSDDQWHQYARNAGVFSLAARSPIAAGEEWVFEFYNLPGRTGQATGSFGIFVQTKLTQLLVDGQPVPNANMDSNTRIDSGGISSSRSVVNVPTLPGKHDVVARYRFEFADDYGQPAYASRDDEFRTVVEVLPEGASTVEAINDASLAPAVRKCLSVGRDGLSVSFIDYKDGNPAKGHINLSLHGDQSPVPLAYDVVLRERPTTHGAVAREWKIGTATFAPGRNHIVGMGGDVTGMNDKSVDIVLRPSPAAAKGTLDMTKYWNHEIVLENVPVRWPEPEPASKPAD